MAGRCCGLYGRHPCDECPTGPVVDEHLADEQPAPLVAGSIGRALVDAAAAHSPRLAQLWGRPVDRPVQLDAGPWDD